MALTGINHLAFITEDMEGTIRFYRDLLGMRLEAGIGHPGFRHYFFQCGNAQVAFFQYAGAAKMQPKPHGQPTRLPLGFDHVSFTVGSREELFQFKDRIGAAGFEVSSAVDHGTVWSIYFYDPNNIPLEISWDVMEITLPPGMSEVEPLDIVAEGAGPQPGHWPEVTNPTPPAAMTAHDGNGYDMRQAILREGRGHVKEDYRRLVEEQQIIGQVEAAE